MEDPQPQNTDIIVEPSTFDAGNNDVIQPVIEVDTNAVNNTENYDTTSQIANQEADQSPIQDESVRLTVVVPEVEPVLQIEQVEQIGQVEQETSSLNQGGNDSSEVPVNPSKNEESDNDAGVVEKAVPESSQQTEQDQNNDLESNNPEQNPDQSQVETAPGAVVSTNPVDNTAEKNKTKVAEIETARVISTDTSKNIKEVPEDEETEEIKETGPEVHASWRKERSPKLNHLRVQTQAKHMEESAESTNPAITEIKLQSAEAEGETQEEAYNQSQERPKTNGSPSLKKAHTESELPDIVEPLSSPEKILKPAPFKRVSSQNDVIGKQNTVADPEQPHSAATPSRSRVSMEDFQKITSVGRGSYGEVFLVKKISTGKLYALKSIDKNFMKKERKEHQVYVEREVLLKLNHPNIIKLYSSFQDKNKLYFVLEYASGGEFSDYLRVQGKLSREQIVFFTAEIINILEYIHSSGIAHRDLKPENILLTQEGHLKCIDFGTARYINIDKRTADLYEIKNKAEETLDGPPYIKKNRTTFVGTAQYVSPEMLDGADTGASADLWALGCIIYLMATGKFAFIDINEYLIFQKIKAVTVKYPDDMDPVIKDLVQKLLVKNPEDRLGAGVKGSENGYDALKAHPLFKDVRFSDLHEQPAPIVEIASPHKRKSFDFEQGATPTNKASNNRKHFHSDDLSRTESGAINAEPTEKGRIIISGLVLKRGGWWFFRPRQLILNSKAKLVYYDPDSNQLRGEIFLAPTTRAQLDSKTKFTIITPTRKFTFKEMEHSAEKWVEIINATIAQRYPKRSDN